MMFNPFNYDSDSSYDSDYNPDSDVDIGLDGTAQLYFYDFLSRFIRRRDSTNKLGTIRTSVVGISHYRTIHVTPKMKVRFERDPGNSYDPNAIKAMCSGIQFGHLRRELAEILAPYLDNGGLHLEGVIVSCGSFAHPLDLTLYGHQSLKVELTRKLNGKNFGWNIPGVNRGRNGQRGGSGYVPMNVSAEEQVVKQKKLKGELEKVFEGVAKKLGKGFNKVKVSDGISTKLYPHQLQALSWMCDRENNKELPPFWKSEKKTGYKNVVTEVKQQHAPAPLCGGFLADEMGLGKSLEVIALILTNGANEVQTTSSRSKKIVADSAVNKNIRSSKKAITAKSLENGRPKRKLARRVQNNGDVLANKEKEIVSDSESTTSRNSSVSHVTLSSDDCSDYEKPAKLEIISISARSPKIRAAKQKKQIVKNASSLSTIAEAKSPSQTDHVVSVKKGADHLKGKKKTAERLISVKKPAARKVQGRAAKLKAISKLLSSSEDEYKTRNNIGGEFSDDCVSVVRSIDSSNDEKLKREVIELLSDSDEESSAVCPIASFADSDLSVELQAKKPKVTENEIQVMQPCSSKSIDKIVSSASYKTKRKRVNNKTLKVDDDFGLDPESFDVFGRFKCYALPFDCDLNKGSPKSTLLVCTVSLLSNWLEQFETHVKSNWGLSIFLYYGPDRFNYAFEYIMSHDIVISTYTLLASDFKILKSGGKSDEKGKQNKTNSLLDCEFLRIVLDEGHLIRNPKTKMSQALFSIEAKRRWILSGTPIQNSLSELWALMRFLRLEPFENPSNGQWLWKQHIERPVLNGSDLIVKSFKSLLMTLVLRRTKTMCIDDQPIVYLPKKTVKLLKVKLSTEEKNLYQSMESSGRVIVGSYFKEGRQLTHYAHIMAIITRLRQLVCHPSLCKKAFDLANEAISSTCDDETRVKLIETLKLIISSGSDEECCVCLDSLVSPVITKCAHVFCRKCIEKVLQTTHEGSTGNCPLCRTLVNKNELIEAPREVSLAQTGGINSDDEWHSSSKVDALVHTLNDVRERNPTTKSIVVSQFTAFLSLIEKPLKESGFKFTRFDGTLSAKKRDQVLNCFKTDPNTTVLLLSLRAGNLGLNLTCASNLFLMDPAWNPSVEDQCFDRCHRLGQDKEVTIYKLICTETIEDKILEIQERKRRLIQEAFSFTDAAKESREKRVGDIKLLFGIATEKD